MDCFYKRTSDTDNPEFQQLFIDQILQDNNVYQTIDYLALCKQLFITKNYLQSQQCLFKYQDQLASHHQSSPKHSASKLKALYFKIIVDIESKQFENVLQQFGELRDLIEELELNDAMETELKQIEELIKTELDVQKEIGKRKELKMKVELMLEQQNQSKYYYLVDIEWFDNLINYCSVQQVEDIEDLPRHPGMIDNTNLIQEIDETNVINIVYKSKYQLISNLQIQQDFIAINQQTFQYLYDLFGCKYTIQRKMISKQLHCQFREINLILKEKIFKLYLYPNQKIEGIKKIVQKSISENYQQLIFDIELEQGQSVDLKSIKLIKLQNNRDVNIRAMDLKELKEVYGVELQNKRLSDYQVEDDCMILADYLDSDNKYKYRVCPIKSNPTSKRQSADDCIKSKIAIDYRLQIIYCYYIVTDN